jgi:hypothetical protein
MIPIDYLFRLEGRLNHSGCQICGYFGALDFNVASWGLMNTGMAEIRLGKYATH